jgi:hypothetical protein
MSQTLEELVEALTLIDVAEHLDDPERLPELLAERQRLLAAIQAADASALSEVQRAALKERLQAQAERDARLLATLETMREETAKALEQLASGRAAVRGYGEAMGSTPPPVRRYG